jgi:hypothetical protein
MSNSNTSQRRLFKDLQRIRSEELPGLFILSIKSFYLHF